MVFRLNPQQKMEMIRHQAIRINIRNGSDVEFKPFQEKQVVIIFTENQIIPVTMIINMVNGIRYKGFSRVGHWVDGLNLNKDSKSTPDPQCLLETLRIFVYRPYSLSPFRQF